MPVPDVLESRVERVVMPPIVALGESVAHRFRAIALQRGIIVMTVEIQLIMLDDIADRGFEIRRSLGDGQIQLEVRLDKPIGMILVNLTVVPVRDAGAFAARLRTITIASAFGFRIEAEEQPFLMGVFAEGCEAVGKAFEIRLEPFAVSLAPRRAVHHENFHARRGGDIHTLFHRGFVVI